MMYNAENRILENFRIKARGSKKYLYLVKGNDHYKVMYYQKLFNEFKELDGQTIEGPVNVNVVKQKVDVNTYIYEVMGD